MRPVLQLVLTAALAVTALFAVPASAAEVFERVKKSGVLRCAYFIVPPEFNKDPNTGELSGIGYEVTEAAARSLNLKVEWVREIGLAEITSGLKAGHYDAVCSSVFNAPAIGREADFTIPFMYTPVGIYVRQGDARFDADRDSINDPGVTIAAIDGETSSHIARINFPNAQIYSMPQNSDLSHLLESVATGKADVAFTYPANFLRYDKNNPGKLKSIHEANPVRAFGNTIVLPKGAAALKSMLDTALEEVINSGEADRIIEKYEEFPGAYYRVIRPYEVRR